MSTTIKLAPPALRASLADAVEAGAAARERQPRSLPRRDAHNPPPAVERRSDAEALPAHLQRLYRGAYCLCGSREEAEALWQDTYEKVLRRPRFPRRDHDLGCLLRVLRDTWISSKPTTRPVTYVGAGDDLYALGPPEDPIASMVQTRALYETLQDLAPPLRAAIVAVDVVGLSYKDAARAEDQGRNSDETPPPRARSGSEPDPGRRREQGGVRGAAVSPPRSRAARKLRSLASLVGGRFV